jgi:hypothetical protein
MDFDDERAEEIYETAVYAALTEGQRHETSDGVTYRLETGHWLISFRLLRSRSPVQNWFVRPSVLKNRCLKQEVRVAYGGRTVFRALGTPVVPRDQQLLADSGQWRQEFMERWGMLVH